MENKNFLVKNLFYILFALCFLSAGFLTLNKIPTQTAVAEDVSSEDVENTNIPDYFLREEFVYDSETSSSTKNEASLISQNTFVYFSESGRSNSLKLSLAMSGRRDTDEIYQYVYYPNPDDSSLFYFYTVENYDLTINGEVQDTSSKEFKDPSELFFENYSSTISPEGFYMVLNGTGTGTNEIKITDDDGNVKEGVYTLSMKIILFTCNNGKSDGSEGEADFLPEEEVDIDYTFYVLAQDSYLTNGRPNITSGAFDNEVTLSSGSTAYNLFSNYTSKAGVGSSTAENQIPYVEYDYTRFELDIKKDLTGEVKNSSLVYDKDSESVKSIVYDANGEVVSNGAEIVHFELKENNICRVYFKDVGNYTLTLNAIKLVEMNGKLHKFALDGVSSITKKVGVYMYGYQLGYTDFDQAPNENNNRPLGELKTPYYTQTTVNGVTHNEGTFGESADITSEFVKSNNDYAQGTTTTFTRRNIVNFLNGKTAVSTNQTPIKFVSNATLDTSRSYILTTEQLPNFTPSTAPKLNSKSLYEKAFTGQTENSAGTYIYVLAYTYKDYTNSLTIFYQIFYFEIEKGSPSITLTTYADEVADRKTIYSNTYTNQNALLVDTANSAYNKDVTVQVYAYDYTKETYETDENHYMTDFGGTSGISLAQMLEKGNISGAYTINDDGSVTLEAKAKYTIRLYYSSTMKNTDINSSNSNIGLASEQIFTIDKYEIEHIQGRNVTQVASGYQILSTMSTFTTNQNMVISWDKKDSGAKSYAYYRYFPLEKAQYYSSDANNVSKLLGDNMLAQTKDFLPVNNVLNLNASANNGWIPLASNTSSGGNTYDFDVEDIISAEYVLSEAGFYLVDIFDEAGNHKVDVFFIDTSSPVFAISNGSTYTYSIASSTQYVDTTSTLYWGDFKAIYIANFNTELYKNYTPTNLNETILSGANKNTFYRDKNGNISTDIFNAMYEKLYGTHMQYITCNSATIPNDISSLVTSYSGMYMTIKIEGISYYADDVKTKGEYVKLEREVDLEGKNRKTFVVDKNELTARLLIRDISNTKYDLTINDKYTAEQYTKYYSARQIVKISFDDSKFKITYQNSDKNDEELLANISEESGDEKISYFNPTKMNKAFKLSFVPTTNGGSGKSVQVSMVKIDYYRFIDSYYEDGNGKKYYYSTLSNTAEPYTIYDVSQNGASTEVFESYIGYSNSAQITNPGKYVITRTYATGDTYTHDSKDFLTRTFVLIVDRNGVVSEPTSPSSATDGHTESLVGGDIFVSMFDNGKDSSIVVNFPNSEAGNTDGTSIYNNGGVKTILTTNKLPVNVYVPKYKYTKYVSQNKTYDGQGNETSYDFELTNNDELNNFKTDLQIKEYVLYAQIYKNGTNPSNLIATSQNSKTPATDAGGFLKFYSTSGEELTPLIDPGEYYVKIYQGFGSEAGDNCFEQSLTFKFEIKSATPDFIVQQVNGASLQSDPATNAEYSQIYYTNTSELCLIWEASTDKYKVEIDIEKITLKTSDDTPYTYADDIWTRVPTLQENKTYLAQLNLEKLSGVYKNDGWVDITMQFKNQDEEQVLYKPVTKRIYVDLSAPSNNVNNLVSKSISDTSISSLTTSALRIYQTANFQVAKNLDETSYNISNSSGTFAYYSYSISPTYLETLKTTKDFKTYIRAFEDSAGNSTKYVSGIEQETEPSKFLATNFIDLDSVTALERNTYYEIVETDKAGNMAIYTIYVVDYESNSNLISYSYNTGREEIDTAYTTEKFNLVKAHSGAIHNIYSPTDFILSDINFFGDEWAQINLVTYNSRGESKSNMTLMLTPNDKGYALAFVGEATPQRVAISSLIDGSVGSMFKNVMSIYNRESGATETFYFTIYNTSLSASLTTQQDREYIQFNNVSDTEIQNTKTGTTYLTELKITAYNSASDTGVVIYERQNPLGYASGWESNSSINVTTTANLTFELRPELNFTPNATRIVYEFKDNYGKTYKEIHIYRETVITQEITSIYDLYTFTNEGTTYYITNDFFKYTYNPSKYDVQVYDVISNEISQDLTNATKTSKQNTDGTTTLTISSNLSAPYNKTFVIEVRDTSNDDPSTNLVKRIYFILYNELPSAVQTGNTVSAGQFMLLDANGNNITNKIVGNVLNTEAGYFSEARLVYSVAETFLPIKYSISTDKLVWTEVASGTRLRSVSGEMEKYYLKVWYDETYIPNDSGNPAYVFGKVLSTQIYEFNLSALSSSYWVEKTVDGVTTIVERSKNAYRAENGAEYANHYIVNLDYATNQNAVKIKVNKEQDIQVSETPTIFRNGNVVSELWFISNTGSQTGSNIPAFETSIVITYIPTSDNFVQEFYTSNINGIIEKDNLVGKTQSSLIVSQNDSAVDKVVLQWSKYYGIAENEINIKILKDGLELKPEIYSKREGYKQYNYTYLMYSGKYSITLYDDAGNIQKFNVGSSGQSEVFTFIFLKDVPFTVTYTNPHTGELETSLPIKQAVYNSAITLNIDESTRSEFYKMGEYPAILVKKNGVEYATDFADNATTYTFDEAGYYEISFTATSKDPNVGKIRQEIYQFTILNPDEYKISYVYNQYSNYYVEKVVKDGKDITEELLKTLDLQTITIGGKNFLTQLPISYLDEKTGVGNYEITINSNNQLFKNSSLVTSWTFKVTINRGTAPLQISIGEGSSTTSPISVKFNQSNIYSEMGECTLRIVRQNSNGSLSLVNSTDINATSTGETTQSISQDGTFFVQIVSPSGALMFSYKVTKTAPMNAASIIAIVISAVVLVAVIFIVIKLRKRIAVK